MPESAFENAKAEAAGIRQHATFPPQNSTRDTRKLGLPSTKIPTIPTLALALNCSPIGRRGRGENGSAISRLLSTASCGLCRLATFRTACPFFALAWRGE